MTAPTARPAAPPTGRPVILDAYSGAGGAAVGYHRAGFDVVGVDIVPQPRYPFAFEQGDAIEFIRRHGREFDAIHASPPCQRFTQLQRVRGREHPDLIGVTRDALLARGLPFVIENVPGAPLRSPAMLCGSMFPILRVYRHRLFECSCFFLVPPHRPHRDNTPRVGRGASTKGFISVAGKGGYRGWIHLARRAMQIDWMTCRELSQAIPPAYTAFIGAQLLRALGMTS